MSLFYSADFHTHSVASGHGSTDTIIDMARQASVYRLTALGITDHGPATLASASASYFRTLKLSPHTRFGIRLFYGVELNLLDDTGNIDLSDEILKELDYAIISMHRKNYRDAGRSANTTALIAAMDRPHVKILGHCDDPAFPLDYALLLQNAKERNIFPELNEASLTPGGYRGDTAALDQELIWYCRKYQLPLLLSSDSHGKEKIGCFDYSLRFLEKENFPEELILNNRFAGMIS